MNSTKQRQHDKGARISRVLLVEDEPQAREACELYLSRRGFDVAVAADAEEAEQQAAQTRPHVAVCDWRLANGDNGVDVAEKLQQLYDIPVIFVTAFPMDELRDASDGLNVLGYMRKPISLPDLADTISQARR